MVGVLWGQITISLPGAGGTTGMALAKDDPQLNMSPITAEFAHSKGGSKLYIRKAIYMA